MTADRIYRRAQFRLSAPTPADLGPDEGIEVAFAGRSNVGKSSVLNALTGQRKLARTSGTPGRTQTINCFDLDETRRLIDLPGYGYAKVPQAVKRRWEQALPEYLRNRQALYGVVVIMDVRHAPTELDLQMLRWCADAGLVLHGVLTKADKLKRGAARNRLQAVRQAAAEAGVTLPSVQLFSALKGEGIDELTEVLDAWFAVGNSSA
ncbi:ribosome biogenesis GTP-binding protein YihA/YsxC [Halorhodospira sp. 9621]|uniref:ribosome biogenesis GTP-binding protein YihA/YsxC n=1 Tax=Halorhodospira TaxID=85108 RepID=UPI001EE9891A|nr:MULTISPECIES: ribosome biogenesis GTP-binding protein YihA/YsxC [Halorhodospira]MCG5527169.1 ribosome biogenesis GTP-binding protein YihA/YsxC [Halorhodospira halophila]MCG5532986.1 ribosome biogenesis GTP-binding protein YihA/YsxC [Halorhodospira sp. 9621]MCG5543487.1 ribosome biogenesis GTP-binding protein YihA/YsxC [Halorhodospira sp. 9628]